MRGSCGTNRPEPHACIVVRVVPVEQMSSTQKNQPEESPGSQLPLLPHVCDDKYSDAAFSALATLAESARWDEYARLRARVCDELDSLEDDYATGRRLEKRLRALDGPLASELAGRAGGAPQ